MNSRILDTIIFVHISGADVRMHILDSEICILIFRADKFTPRLDADILRHISDADIVMHILDDNIFVHISDTQMFMHTLGADLFTTCIRC